MSHRHHADISSNDNEDDLDSQMCPSKNIREHSSAPVPRQKHRIQEDNNSSSDSPDKNMRSDDSTTEEDNNNDLQWMGNEDLVSVFASEVIILLSLDFLNIILISAAHPLVLKAPSQQENFG